MNDETTGAEEPQNDGPDEQKPAKSAATTLDLSGIEGPEDVIAWLKENGTPILVGLTLAALAFAGFSAYRNHQRAAATTAQSQLFNSQTTAQFMDIVTKYADAPAAPLAELSLAGQQFEDGQFDMARSTYAAFLTKHAEHSLKSAAAMGLAQCDEAQLKLGDALTKYENFIKQEPDSFLQAQAIFGKGRCLEQMGRFDDARTVYEDFIAGHPKDPWVQRAETALMYVGKSKRAAENRAAHPPAAMIPVAKPAVSAAPAPAPVIQTAVPVSAAELPKTPPAK